MQFGRLVDLSTGRLVGWSDLRKPAYRQAGLRDLREKTCTLPPLPPLYFVKRG